MILTQIKKAFNTICVASIAFLAVTGTILYKQNKKLSESLEMAHNNIEAYQGIVNDSQQANNVLQLTVEDLQNTNDVLVQKMDSIKDELKIKDKQLKTAATQMQTIVVNDGKELDVNLLEVLKDTVYRDSLKYNNLTTVYYMIGKDTVNIGLDIKNTQYLFVYHTKEYKNKKSFIKRLLTLDFKKVNKYKYTIENTNDIIKTDSVRIVEIKK